MSGTFEGTDVMPVSLSYVHCNFIKKDIQVYKLQFSILLDWIDKNFSMVAVHICHNSGHCLTIAPM